MRKQRNRPDKHSQACPDFLLCTPMVGRGIHHRFFPAQSCHDKLEGCHKQPDGTELLLPAEAVNAGFVCRKLQNPMSACILRQPLWQTGCRCALKMFTIIGCICFIPARILLFLFSLRICVQAHDLFRRLLPIVNSLQYVFQLRSRRHITNDVMHILKKPDGLRRLQQQEACQRVTIDGEGAYKRPDSFLNLLIRNLLNRNRNVNRRVLILQELTVFFTNSRAKYRIRIDDFQQCLTQLLRIDPAGKAHLIAGVVIRQLRRLDALKINSPLYLR